jgi:hypothetical protein
MNLQPESGQERALFSPAPFKRPPASDCAAAFSSTAVARQLSCRAWRIAAQGIAAFLGVVILLLAVHPLGAAEVTDDDVGILVIINLILPPEANTIRKTCIDKVRELYRNNFSSFKDVDVVVGGGAGPDKSHRYRFTLTRRVTLTDGGARGAYMTGTLVGTGAPAHRGGFVSTVLVNTSDTCQFTDTTSGKSIRWHSALQTACEGEDTKVKSGIGMKGAGGSPVVARQLALQSALALLADGWPGPAGVEDRLLTARVIRVYRDEPAWKKMSAGSSETTGTRLKEEKGFLVAEVEITNTFTFIIGKPRAEVRWLSSLPVQQPAISPYGHLQPATGYDWYEHKCKAEIPRALLPGTSAKTVCPVFTSEFRSAESKPARGSDLVPQITKSGRPFPGRDRAWFDQCLAELRSPDVAKRKAAAQALLKSPVIEAVEPLRVAAKDTDAQVSSAASAALGALEVP